MEPGLNQCLRREGGVNSPVPMPTASARCFSSARFPPASPAPSPAAATRRLTCEILRAASNVARRHCGATVVPRMLAQSHASTTSQDRNLSEGRKPITPRIRAVREREKKAVHLGAGGRGRTRAGGSQQRRLPRCRGRPSQGSGRRSTYRCFGSRCARRGPRTRRVRAV